MVIEPTPHRNSKRLILKQARRRRMQPNQSSTPGQPLLERRLTAGIEHLVRVRKEGDGAEFGELLRGEECWVL